MVASVKYEIVNVKNDNNNYTHTYIYASLNKRYKERQKRQSYNAIWSYQLQFNVKPSDKWIQRNGEKKLTRKKRKIKLTMVNMWKIFHKSLKSYT